MAAEIDQQKEMKAHAGTYGLFVGMMKWGTIAAFIVAALVVWLIAG